MSRLGWVRARFARPMWRPTPASLVTALSVSRFAAIPVFIGCLVSGETMWLAVVYTSAVATDFLDGKIARRLGTASRGGATLDLVADVSFNAGALSAAAALGKVGPWVPAMVALLGARFLLRRRANVQLTKDRFGHFAGVAFYALVGLVAANAAFGFPSDGWLLRLADAVSIYAAWCLWRGWHAPNARPSSTGPGSRERLPRPA